MPAAAETPATLLLVPGLWNSGPEHWQSHWERAAPDGFRPTRVLQADWETPRREDWVATLERAVAGAAPPVLLAAHSLGCALVAHWAAAHPDTARAKLAGALLVGPSDVEAPSYPQGPTGFAPMPLAKLPFRAVVVASTDDPYVRVDRAEAFAAAWGAPLVLAGAKGHLNSDSRLGGWPEGVALLRGLRGA